MPRLRSVATAVSVLALTAIGSSACAPTVSAPAFVPSGGSPMLRAIPAVHGLSIGERRAVQAVLEDGRERIVSVAIGANTKVADPAIASLEDGVLTGLARGTTTLRISYEPGGYAVTVPIVVTDATPDALELNEITAPRIGERLEVRATVRYADGTVGDATLDADWSTPTANRLFVPNTPETRGAVVAVMPKQATLVARLGDLEARTEIVPAFGEPSGIHVRLAWSHGEFRRFGAFAHWSDGEVREVSAGCLWRVPGTLAFRGLERPQHGPWVAVSDLAWDRIATCELGTSKTSGALFGP
ncbi:MAG: hypothetical protein HYV09_12540 [Deltaproteobacteria bacterium]|nr:hypothetical protein [Deltaproteobacteria bacterium]